jgi:hypothetical protein
VSDVVVYNTPLHVALGNGHQSVAEFLLQNMADWERKNKAGEKPLDMLKMGEKGVSSSLSQAESYSNPEP